MQQVALNLPNIWPKIASFYQKLLSNFDLLFGSLKRPKVVEMQQSCMLWQPWCQNQFDNFCIIFFISLLLKIARFIIPIMFKEIQVSTT